MWEPQIYFLFKKGFSLYTVAKREQTVWPEYNLMIWKPEAKEKECKIVFNMLLFLS